MTEQDKQLLLKDLCTRLPYGVICHTEKGDGHLCSINQTIFGTEYGVNISPIKRDYFSDSEQKEVIIKPYLRPMSSITKEEKEDIKPLFKRVWTDGNKKLLVVRQNKMAEYLDYLYSHHFDFCGLIDKSLALVAPEYMYLPE